MVITKKVHRVNAPSHPLHNENYMKGRIGFWAIVKEVNSLNNTVTVISDTGFEYPNIQVMSSEWVTVDDNKDYIPSERNLPPVNSRVFVLTPTFTAVGAFVLCSGFSRGDENIRTLWAANENELEDKNNCREIKTQGGWDITEEYSNGNYKAVSNDGKITINANTTEDSDKEQKKEISLNAWDNVITVNEDGITVTDKSGNKIESTSDGLKLTDKNKNVINMTATNIQIMADETKKIKIGNSTDTIKGILSDILTILNSTLAATGPVEGSTATTTVTPGQFTDIITKLNTVME